MSHQSNLDENSETNKAANNVIRGPKLGIVGWARFCWRQLTSMNVALMLLLLLAIAAIPGSLVPQRASDPNGVTQYFTEHAKLAPIYDKLQLFDVYGSVWFSAIYLLLFISLIGCLLPRIKQHWKSMRMAPPRTPVRLQALTGYINEPTLEDAEQVLARAETALHKRHYRTKRYQRAVKGQQVHSVSAERGYLRETGNIVFHLGLVGVLCSVAFGGFTTYDGQRVLVEGQTFANSLAAYDSFNPGKLFNQDDLPAYSLTLDKFVAKYEQKNMKAYGQPIDYRATMTVTQDGKSESQLLRVNHPLRVKDTDIYLLGNGYAPVVTVRDAAGKVVFKDAVAFLPQDASLTSLGVIKVTDTKPKQLGLVGFFYPTAVQMSTGAYTSTYPGLINPLLTLNVYAGDLGLEGGVPKSVYQLDTSKMTPIATRQQRNALEMKPGQTVKLPQNAGTVTFEGVKRFASLEMRHDVSGGWMLGSVLIAVAGLLLSLFVPRRRMWVAVTTPDTQGDTAEPLDGVASVEIAALARGDDPRLESATADLRAAILPAKNTDTGPSQG